MDYFDNDSFAEQLDPESQIQKKSRLNTYLIISLLITTASTMHFYFKMKEYQEELARRSVR
jgi:hypothetical protein